MFFLSVASWSPVCFRVFQVDIYWYGLSYVLGIWLALVEVRYLCRKFCPEILEKSLDAFLPFACLGILVGGRLGHVFFYESAYYANHVLEIFKTRQGGMSFHGGLIGVTLAILWFCWSRHIKLLRFLDVLASAAPIGLGIGRVANFINNELYGKPTDLPFGVFFRNVEQPRHPTQIYEALLEGVLLGWILFRLWKNPPPREGVPSCVFLIGYAVFRIIIDCFKESSPSYSPLTGQGLSLVMLIIGVGLYYLTREKMQEHKDDGPC